MTFSKRGRRSFRANRVGYRARSPDCARNWRLARARRCDSASSLRKNKAAVSAAVNPQTVFSARKSWSCGASAGSQHRTMRSSSGSLSEGVMTSSSLVARSQSSSMPSSRAERRMRSIAVLPATRRSQALGLSGMPLYGQVARALTIASCATSSARSTLPGPSRETRLEISQPRSRLMVSSNSACMSVETVITRPRRRLSAG